MLALHNDTEKGKRSMYARVTSFQIEAFRLDEALEVTSNSILCGRRDRMGCVATPFSGSGSELY